MRQSSQFLLVVIKSLLFQRIIIHSNYSQIFDGKNPAAVLQTKPQVYSLNPLVSWSLLPHSNQRCWQFLIHFYLGVINLEVFGGRTRMTLCNLPNDDVCS